MFWAIYAKRDNGSSNLLAPTHKFFLCALSALRGKFLAFNCNARAVYEKLRELKMVEAPSLDHSFVSQLWTESSKQINRKSSCR